MPRYRVSITRDITEEAIVEVEALNVESALDAAQQLEQTEDLEWRTTDWGGDSYYQIFPENSNQIRSTIVI